MVGKVCCANLDSVSFAPLCPSIINRKGSSAYSSANTNGYLRSGVVSYYLALILEIVGITSVTQQTLLNGFLNLWNLIMAVAAALLVDRVSRKKLFLCSTSIMLVAYIVITALSATFAKDGVKAVGTAVSTYKSLNFSELILPTGHSILIHLLRRLRYRLYSSSDLLPG